MSQPPEEWGNQTSTYSPTSRLSEGATGPSSEGPTRKPRHASVFGTHSDTQAVPAFHCIRMFKGIFRHASVFKTHHCLKEVQKPFRHASVFKTRVSTRACPFLKRAFRPSKGPSQADPPLRPRPPPHPSIWIGKFLTRGNVLRRFFCS